ncbi:unnamed protein product [Phytophthora lilii]|uniref:Unnamed protein product n=1 Tax=Phytophthora lilii TaxID=2077276 RepID=A0A9W7CHH3_9STRA|nr:unnamed protein product [Phytophthora lilii]
MAPVKWNQGGYDAVLIDKAEQLIRLVTGDLNQVAVVELCLVVPTANLEEVTLPVSKEGFKSVVVVALSTSRAP